MKAYPIGATAPRNSMRCVLGLFLCLLAVQGVTVRAARAADPADLTPLEARREKDLRNRLCALKNLSCDYVDSIFSDPRFAIYQPPAPSPAVPPAPPSRVPQPNPYLTTRFGLLTPESLERCRAFIAAHSVAFDVAQGLYGVPREVICGHLRIETNFGVATPLTPYPFGTFPAIDRLVSLYVRRPPALRSDARFLQRQRFAVEQLDDLLVAARQNGWDLFEIPGSSTGAIGLGQFEPSVFNVAVDGDGDGKIDLFDPDDAIPSVAHYLATRGWDNVPDHQRRAIYAYYGGHYDSDRYKYYMKGVLAYADAVRAYLQEHPIEPDAATDSRVAVNPAADPATARASGDPNSTASLPTN